MNRWMKPSKKAIVTTVGTGDSRPMNKRTFIRLRWTACASASVGMAWAAMAKRRIIPG